MIFQLIDPLGGPVVSAGGGKYYYAKGVGLIESYFGFSFFTVYHHPIQHDF